MDDVISVIVPVYNTEKDLTECLNSLLEQTYQALEIIVVDDGSKDQSPKICDEFAEKDSRIKVIHQENKGLSAARNAGLAQATGSYIAFVDSDDYVNVAMYEKLLAALKKEDADMAVCGYEKVLDSGEKREHISSIKDEILSGKDFFKKLFKERWWNFAVVWNRVYKRDIWQELRFPVGRQNEDLFVFGRTVLGCRKIVTISDLLYSYRDAAGSIMHRKPSVKNLDGVEAACENYWACKECGYMELRGNMLRFVGAQFSKYVGIPCKTKDEKERKKDILAMYRLVYKDVEGKKKLRETALAKCPNIYAGIKKIMRK